MRALHAVAKSWSTSFVGRPFALVAAFTLVAAGSATAIGGGLPRIIAAADAGVADMMRSRSPGRRGATYMTKFRAAPRPVHRIARALPRIRQPMAPLVAAVPPPLIPALPYFAESIAPPLIPVSGGILEGPAVPCGCGFFSPGIIIPPFGGGGGGIFLLPPGGTVVTPPPPPAVPEPAAWATLILGFGLLGGALRARQSDARRLA